METETLYQKLLKQGYEEFGLVNQLEPGHSVIKLLKAGAKEVKSYRYKDLYPKATNRKPDDIILFYK